MTYIANKMLHLRHGKVESWFHWSNLFVSSIYVQQALTLPSSALEIQEKIVVSVKLKPPISLIHKLKHICTNFDIASLNLIYSKSFYI